MSLVGHLRELTSGILGGKARMVPQSWAFNFCTKWTPWLLVALAMAASSTQHFGSPIECDSGGVSK